MKVAKAKYITLIAAADLLSPNYIDRCVHNLENEDKEMVFINAFSVDQDSKVGQGRCLTEVGFKEYEKMVQRILKSNFASGSKLFFKLAYLN